MLLTSPNLKEYAVPFAAQGIALGKGLGALVRAQHKKLQKAMNTHGVLQPKFEHLFPNRWIDSAAIARTHPVCYIDMHGNMIFKKLTKKEYYFHVLQKSPLGHMGFHPGRWRIFLKPPEAPEAWKEWAKNKLEQEKAKRKRVPAPVPGLSHSKTRKKRHYLRPLRA